MTDFYPFIYEPKQKEFEPEPLQIELYEPLIEENQSEEKEETPAIIIIQL